MNKYDRLLFILNLLRSRKNLNAEAIAVECGVTARSIYRDIIALSEANVPIYYDNGYKMASDAFLPPLNFEYDEYSFLSQAIKATPLGKTGKYPEIAKKVRAKIEAGLSEAVRRKARFAPVTTHVEIPSSQPSDRVTRFFAPLEDAITKSHRVKIEYRSIESGRSERIIEPYFIAFRGKAFYLVAFCRLKEQFRTFRLERIEELTTLDESYDRDPHVNAEEYFSGSWSVYTGDPVDVVIRFTGASARVVASSVHHRDEQIEDLSNDEIIYRVRSRGLEEIERWVLGFGDEALVLEPEQLRDRIRKTAKVLTKKYSGSE